MRTVRVLRSVAAMLGALLLAACAATPEREPDVARPREPAPAAKPAAVPPAKPKPPPPAVAKEPEPPPVAAAPSVALESLRKGLQSYDDGDYREAARQFAQALDQGLAQPADQASARKHLAFIACVARRVAACRAEFRKAFDADPLFDLAPAEAGHPMWGPVFRSVKADVAKRKRAPAPATTPATTAR